MLRRLLSLDYVLEHPHAAWLPTEDERRNALTAAGIAKDVLPRRLYQGAVGAQYRYFPHKLPVALDGVRATFLFVQTDEDETESAIRTWGGQHAAMWAALAPAGRAVEVVVVGRDPVRLAAAEGGVARLSASGRGRHPPPRSRPAPRRPNHLTGHSVDTAFERGRCRPHRKITVLARGPSR